MAKFVIFQSGNATTSEVFKTSEVFHPNLLVELTRGVRSTSPRGLTGLTFQKGSIGCYSTCRLASSLSWPGRVSAGGNPFGKAADGTAVESITLKNKNGMTVKVMSLGATITEIDVPDKNGKFANVVLGFDSAEEYESGKNQSFGATVGRVCNRTAKGKFTLEGKEYQLAINNGPNHLHGGVKRNLSKVVWQIAPVPRSIDSNGKICRV